jgi:hypothetical protein
MSGFIYAIRCMGRVKIGFSTDPFRRFFGIKTSSPDACVLLGYEAGDMAREAELHDRFKDYRTHGEWFELKGAVAEYVVQMEHVPVALRFPELRQNAVITCSPEVLQQCKDSQSDLTDASARVVLIEAFCARHNISAPSLFKQAGIHPSQWSRWRAGKFEPRLKTWRDIETAMAEIEAIA